MIKKIIVSALLLFSFSIWNTVFSATEMKIIESVPLEIQTIDNIQTINLYNWNVPDWEYYSAFLFKNNWEFLVNKNFFFSFMIWFWSFPFLFLMFSFIIFKSFKLWLKK